MKKRKKYFKLIIFIIIIPIILYFSLYLVAKMMPKLPIDSANSYYFYDIEDKLIENSSSKEWVKLKDISEHLINATIAIEDKNFYNHMGFDYLRIVSAFINNITSDDIEGASTITQQYAKNLYLDFDQTWQRKIDEAWLTVRLESHYSKDELLEGYLNTINYGGIFGIDAASDYYFNKEASDLTLSEATILAGIPANPSYYSPISNLDNAQYRQKLILNAMVDENYISETEKEKVINTELVFNSIDDSENLKMLKYYEDAVIDELQSITTIPSSFLTTGGLKIYTNLDLDTQKNLENNIDNYLSEDTELQIASVVMNPNDGAVLALTGGRDYSSSQFNRATDSKRQVGSTIKPFLYYSALENGFTASSTFISEKTTFTFSENKTYSPENYNNNYPNKPISMTAALAYSDNIFAVKTHLFLGENNLLDTTKRVGINNAIEALPASALGTSSINIMDMMRGYSTFANEGYKIDPFFIRRVEDSDGNVLYENKVEKENVLNKSIVYVLNEMLTKSYANEFIDYNYPTCYNIAPKITNKYAIKTGTTNTDHLIFGYNSDIIMGVWAGYDDNSDTLVSDGNHIKNIWVDTVETYLKDYEGNNWYEIPSNVVGVMVDPITGEIPLDPDVKTSMFYYIKGTEPVKEKTPLDNLIPTIKTE